MKFNIGRDKNCVAKNYNDDYRKKLWVSIYLICVKEGSLDPRYSADNAVADYDKLFNE